MCKVYECAYGGHWYEQQVEDIWECYLKYVKLTMSEFNFEIYYRHFSQKSYL